MRWIIRLITFALCAGLGTSAWYILAPKKVASALPVIEKVGETFITQASDKLTQAEQQDDSIQSIRFGPVEPIVGNANVRTILLRDVPDVNAPIVTKIKVNEYESAEILDASGNFLHVRFPANEAGYNDGNVRENDYEGWTDWRSVVPEMIAVVMDAETGEVVARVPLSEDTNSVTFSPDGSHAIFFSDAYARVAYEVQTSDYTLTRSLTTTTSNYFGHLAYAPAGGGLYATAYAQDSPPYSRNAKVSLIRIGNGAANAQTGITASGIETFVFSPDGSKGFILHKETDGSYEMTVDVIDMAASKVSNSFKLIGTELPSGANDFALNRDGSELYVRLSEKADTVSVIETQTGQRVRELKGVPIDHWAYLYESGLVGDSLLYMDWKSNEDEMHTSPVMFWATARGHMKADAGIAYAVEANGKGYAINQNGTQLFKLDSNNHIRERITISRPERFKGASMGNDLTVFGLSASLDGKRLIMFLGFEHGC